jgi:hypothetical protein
MMLMVAQTPGRILFSPVEGLVGLLPVLGVTLQTPVDDVNGGAKPRPDTVLLVCPVNGRKSYIKICFIGRGQGCSRYRLEGDNL